MAKDRTLSGSRNLPKWLPAALCCCLSACQLFPAPASPPVSLDKRVTWDGEPPTGYHADSSEKAIHHTLEFQGLDTVHIRLTQYPSDVQAFRVFQEKANSEELKQGFYPDGNHQVFFQGPFLGEMLHSRNGPLPPTFLKDKLVFQGEELFQKPRAFQAFPIAGQIPNSERVLTPDFLGWRGDDLLPTMAYQCLQDTALLFRSQGPFASDPMSWISNGKGQVDTLNWGREKRFLGFSSDGKPLLFWVFKGGVLGVWGCFDLVLSQEYAEKLKKTTVLLEKP